MKLSNGAVLTLTLDGNLLTADWYDRDAVAIMLSQLESIERHQRAQLSAQSTSKVTCSNEEGGTNPEQ